MVLDLLSGLRGFVKLSGKTDVDSRVSKLHHNFTTLILLAFCLLLTASSLIGKAIHCTFSEHPHLEQEMVDTYCWLHTTFTLPRHYKGPAALHPGVGAFTTDDERVYHAYYQWVPFVLFLQAVMFYAPYWLWEMWEGGVVKAASSELAGPVMNKKEHINKIEMVGEYLHATLGYHNIYFIKYLASEILNLTVTIANICIMDSFLGGKFISYGSEVFSFVQTEDEERTDPMLVLFPRMTKCTFKTVGPSGTNQNLDCLCILPQNILNEKAYLIIWVWLWILLVVGALSILWRGVVFSTPFVRNKLLRTYTHGLNNNEMQALAVHLVVGDYFLLYLMHKNVSRLAFTDLVRDLAGRVACSHADTLEMTEKVDTDGIQYKRMN